MSAATRVARGDRPVVSYDLAAANRDHVVEIQTAHTVYRIARRDDTRVTRDWIDGVTMTSSNRGRDDRTNVRIWRMVRLGERLPYGDRGELSEVRSVRVGGVRVLG